MEIQASRLHARTDENGDPILLLDQNRARWDQLLIRRGLGARERAEALLHANSEAPGMYVIQASIAACHARAKKAEDTDWARIASIYDHLSITSPSPVVELNRAVAHGMAFGPDAGLAIADTLQDALKSYHLLPSVRGDLLFKLKRFDEARAEFERAAGMTRNERERAFLLERASRCIS
jgi:predicted RNA polymerase sigma factor